MQTKHEYTRIFHRKRALHGTARIPQMSGAPEFSVQTTARLGILLCCLLMPCAFLTAAQSPQTDSQQQTPVQPTPEITTTQQSAAPAPSAKPPTSSDTASEVDAHPSVPFESHVNLVPVRVVVHDSNGKAVTNLTKEDFRLFQDRRPQTISHFSVETPASAAKEVVRGEAGEQPADQPGVAVPATLALPSRFVALLFDDVQLNLQDLMQARLAAVRYLDASMEPSERVAIFTTSGQTQVDFTDDRAKIRAMVTQLMPHFIGGIDPSGTSECPPMNYYEADLIENKNDQQAIAAATQDALACDQNNGPNAAAAAAALVTSTARELLNSGDINAQYSIRRLQEVVRRISALPGQRSIVLVSPGFLITLTHEYDLSDVIDRATRANVFVNTLDARGLYTVDPLGDISRPLPAISTASAMGLNLSYRIEGQARQSDVLAELADSTGGFYFHNNNDLNAGFRMTAALPEATYLLAFTPEALKFDGKFHQIKVTLATKEKYTIQARRGFFAPKHGQTPEETAKQDIEEAVFSQEEQQGVPIELQLQYYKSDAVDAKLSVLTRVDVTHVRFEKADGRNWGDLTLVAALFDRNGNFISGNQETVALHLKDATLEKLTHTGMTLKMGFDVKPGGYIIRLVVRDSKAAALSAKNGVIEIP